MSALRQAMDDQGAWQFIGAVLHIIDTTDSRDATTADLGQALVRMQRARERHLPAWAQRDGRAVS